LLTTSGVLTAMGPAGVELSQFGTTPAARRRPRIGAHRARQARDCAWNNVGSRIARARSIEPMFVSTARVPGPPGFLRALQESCHLAHRVLQPLIGPRRLLLHVRRIVLWPDVAQFAIGLELAQPSRLRWQRQPSGRGRGPGRGRRRGRGRGRRRERDAPGCAERSMVRPMLGFQPLFSEPRVCPHPRLVTSARCADRQGAPRDAV
jgi:hypothetical protein